MERGKYSLQILGGIDKSDSGRVLTDSTISWPVGLVEVSGSLSGGKIHFVSKIYAGNNKDY